MKKRIIGVVLVLTAGAYLIYALINNEKKYRKKCDEIDKIWQMFLTLKKWICIKQDDKSIKHYFSRRKYERIAIYGMNHLGVLLMNELKKTDITVAFGVDRNPVRKLHSIRVFKPNDTPSDRIDAIVVTALYDYDKIEEALSKRFDCPIVSLEDVIDDIAYFD